MKYLLFGYHDNKYFLLIFAHFGLRTTSFLNTYKNYRCKVSTLKLGGMIALFMLNASINSKREDPPGQSPRFCTYFQPESRGFVPSELPGSCPGVGPIIKVPSCQLMPHEGTFQLQTDLPSIANLWLQNLFQSWRKTLKLLSM